MKFEHLLPPNWKSKVQYWLDEDLPSLDIGGFVVGEKEEIAVLYGKSDGMLAGRCFFDEIFCQVGCRVEWNMSDGDIIDTSKAENGKVIVARVFGKCRHILIGERIGLNMLSRCSGVATGAAAAVAVATKHGWGGMIAGTRKTTPGFRLVEKYALIVGGAATHRDDLSQMVMLKDNHIKSAGNITSAVAFAKRATGFSMKVEVETSTFEDALEAIKAGADIVMLDNFEPEMLKAVAEQLKKQHPNVILEASGGITAETLPSYFSPFVDVISRGNLTQGYQCLDFSLKII